MSFLSKICGRVRGINNIGIYPENREEEQLHINPRGDLLITQGLPELTEIVRLGDSWQIASTTGQAALTALPTTVAGLTLKNNEPSAGKCLSIDAIGSWEAVVDATQTDVTALFAMLNARNDAVPSGGTAETGFKSLSGRSALPGETALRGATVVNNGWFPHSAEGAQMAAAAAGAQWKVNEARVRGLYLVPPGGSFSIQAVKAAAAAAAQQFFYVRYHRVTLPYVS